MRGILCGILSIPHITIMNQNNVMVFHKRLKSNSYAWFFFLSFFLLEGGGGGEGGLHVKMSNFRVWNQMDVLFNFELEPLTFSADNHVEHDRKTIVINHLNFCQKRRRRRRIKAAKCLNVWKAVWELVDEWGDRERGGESQWGWVKWQWRKALKTKRGQEEPLICRWQCYYHLPD